MAIETQPQENQDHRAEIKAIWARDENKWLFVIVGIVAGFLMGITFRDFLLTIESWQDVITGLFPEAFGIAITILVIDALAARRAVLAKKRDLIFTMGSERTETTIPAVEDLRRHRWLFNGSLHRAVLQKAALQKANLEGANLQLIFPGLIFPRFDGHKKSPKAVH